MILMPGKKSYFDSVSCWEYNFTTCDDGDDDGSIEIGHMKQDGCWIGGRRGISFCKLASLTIILFWL